MTKTILYITNGVLLLTLGLGLTWSVAAQSQDLDANTQPSPDTATERPSTPPTERTTEPEQSDNERTVPARDLVDRTATSTERPNAAAENRADRIQTATERQSAIEARRVEFQANQAERRAALQERAQQRIVNLAANISNRMEAAIRRLDAVTNRLTERIAILNEQGVPTADAVTELNRAQAEIDRARAVLASIDADVVAFVSSENPQASWAQVRTTYATARDAIKAAHTSIRTSIQLLKNTAAAPPVVEDAATTPLTNSNE